MAANHIFKSTTLNLDELFRGSFLERYDFNEYGEVDEKFWLFFFHPVVLDYLEHKVKNYNIKLPDYQQYFYNSMQI